MANLSFLSNYWKTQNNCEILLSDGEARPVTKTNKQKNVYKIQLELQLRDSLNL